MRLAVSLQTLFTLTAEQLARSTRFVQRQRKLSASACAQTLVFRWIDDGKTTLESMAHELQVSPQALGQHLDDKAGDWLKALLVEALRQAHEAQHERLGLLDRFTACVVEDSTILAVPAALAAYFPGHGGGGTAKQGAASIKILLRWDVRNGQLLELSVHAGRTGDTTLAAQAADLPEGSLHLADQGFFSTQRWASLSPRQYWISRVPATTCVFVQQTWKALTALLAEQSADALDMPVLLAEKAGLPCRLVARRCPPEIAARRRHKLRAYLRDKKGRDPSQEQLTACEWVVFATTVPVPMLSAKEVWLVYRCRWQVELLIKRAKSLAGWSCLHGRTAESVAVEVYAKLLGLVVLHWGALLRGSPLNGVSLWKRCAVVKAFAERLLDSLAQGVEAVEAVLHKLVARLQQIRHQPKKQKKPSTRQTLLNPGLAA